MAVGSVELQQLFLETRGLQYGNQAQVGLTQTGAFQIVNAQVVRYQPGDPWDVTPLRVYLGPWVPPQEMVIPQGVVNDIDASNASPSIEGFNVRQQISFHPALQVYAEVTWGSGGVQFTAWVDWPVAGLLFQVSGSFCAVAVVATFPGASLTDANDSNFPELAASLSDEPGGGDSNAAGTFTYPFQAVAFAADGGVADPTTGNYGLNFPVPPMARSVRFIWDNTRDNDNADYPTSADILMRRPQDTTVGVNDGVYVYSFTAGDIGDPRDALAIPARTAYVRVEFPTVIVAPVAGVGAIFELDL